MKLGQKLIKNGIAWQNMAWRACKVCTIWACFSPKTAADKVGKGRLLLAVEIDLAFWIVTEDSDREHPAL